MTKAISVRLDDEAERALARLEASGLSQSEAVRRALVDGAEALVRKKALRAEVAALEADEGDHREMLEVASLMEALRAPR
jgi:Arc/MetJ-type ribon-helix-helix transcriptional regulator